MLGSQKSWEKDAEIPIFPPRTASHYQYSPPGGNWSQLMNLHWCILVNQIPHFILGFTLDGVHSESLEKCRMTYIHHHSTMQYFHCPKNCAPPLHLPSLIPWQPLVCLLSSQFCLFQKVIELQSLVCNIPHRLLLLSNLYLRFF